MLELVVERGAYTSILHCVGRIVAGSEVHRLRNAVTCQADKRIVLLDLAAVDRIDAAGLGLLVLLHTLGYAVGFELQVRKPQTRVRELLELTRLNSVLKIEPSDEVEATGLPVREMSDEISRAAA